MPRRSSGPTWQHRRVGHKVIPHKSGVHRLACLVLYRLLLKHIPRSPLDQSLLRNVLRTEFRRDARLREHAAIRQSMKNGYQTLSLLDSLRQQGTSFGKSQTQRFQWHQPDPKGQVLPPPKDPSPIVRSSPTSPLTLPTNWQEGTQLVPSLNAYLSTLSASYPAPTPPPEPPRLWPYPGGNKILDRPLPQSALTGPRHIPRLVNASGFPMLRVKKPQPAFISKILRDKIETKQRRVNQIQELEETWLVLAEDEDIWDEQMAQLARDQVSRQQKSVRKAGHKGTVPRKSFPIAIEHSDEYERTYAKTVLGIMYDIKAKLLAEDERQKDLAKKFWDIVKQETQLLAEEKEVKRKEKAQLWLDKVKKYIEARGETWVDRSGDKDLRDEKKLSSLEKSKRHVEARGRTRVESGRRDHPSGEQQANKKGSKGAWKTADLDLRL